jgi:hypothetical protein
MTALVQVRFGGRITCQVRALGQRTNCHHQYRCWFYGPPPSRACAPTAPGALMISLAAGA